MSDSTGLQIATAINNLAAKVDQILALLRRVESQVIPAGGLKIPKK